MRLAIVTALTLFRIGAALVIAVFLWPRDAWAIMFPLLLLAFATDLVDGYLARRWHVVSAFGKVVDPLADKVLCLTVLWLIALYYHHWLLLAAAIIITAYDIATMTLRFTTARSHQPVAAASLVAKVKTLVLMTGLSLLVLAIMTGDQPVLLASGAILLVVACILSVWSLTSYLGQTFGVKQEQKS